MRPAKIVRKEVINDQKVNFRSNPGVGVGDIVAMTSPEW